MEIRVSRIHQILQEVEQRLLCGKTVAIMLICLGDISQFIVQIDMVHITVGLFSMISGNGMVTIGHG